MKTDELELTIAKPLNEIRGALQQALQRVKAKSIETLDFDDDPLAAPTEPADCDVLLVALGDGAFTRIVKSGLRYSYSLSKSVQIRNTIATYLH